MPLMSSATPMLSALISKQRSRPGPVASHLYSRRPHIHTLSGGISDWVLQQHLSDGMQPHTLDSECLGTGCMWGANSRQSTPHQSKTTWDGPNKEHSHELCRCGTQECKATYMSCYTAAQSTEAHTHQTHHGSPAAHGTADVKPVRGTLQASKRHTDPHTTW